MDLSYYDKQSSKIVFPLLLDLYMQCCEQRAELKNEYEKKQERNNAEAANEKQIVTVFRYITRLWNYTEKRRKKHVKSNYTYG